MEMRTALRPPGSGRSEDRPLPIPGWERPSSPASICAWERPLRPFQNGAIESACRTARRSITRRPRAVPDLVNRPAGWRRPGLVRDVLGVRGRQHLLGGVGLVLAHLQLFVAESVVDPQARDAPRVLPPRIERDAVFLARQHFAKPA